MILIDTGPLVALCDARDSMHKVAVGHFTALRGEEFAVCDAVLTETLFHLPHHSQRQRLGALLSAVRAESVPALYDAAFREEVMEWLVRYAEHTPDWTDGCLATLSQRYARSRVWTYDREFTTTWRRPDGHPIPLAIQARTGKKR